MLDGMNMIDRIFSAAHPVDPVIQSETPQRSAFVPLFARVDWLNRPLILGHPLLNHLLPLRPPSALGFSLLLF